MKQYKQEKEIKKKWFRFIKENYDINKDEICDFYWCKEWKEMTKNYTKTTLKLRRTDVYVHNIIHCYKATIWYNRINNTYTYNNIPHEFEHYVKKSKSQKRFW